jgi:hypothetical protein
MDSAEAFLAEALRCMRLERSVTDPDVKKDLRTMALDFMSRAKRSVEAKSLATSVQESLMGQSRPPDASRRHNS